MSDDAKKDIMKAVQDSQSSSKPTNDNTGTFPQPKYLQHSLDQDGTLFPRPTVRQDGKDKK